MPNEVPLTARQNAALPHSSLGNSPHLSSPTQNPPTPFFPACQLLSTLNFVKLDSRDTPPPLLHSPAVSEFDRVSPAETTPVSTPRATSASVFPRKAAREKDLLFSWHHRASPGFDPASQIYPDSALFDCDLDEAPFPLFGQSPPKESMSGGTAPIGIAIRHNSSSPHQSSLTSALREANHNELRPSDNYGYMIPGKTSSGRHDSVSMSGLTPQYSNGAIPISMNGSARQQQRRESNAAGSMMGGMSWGGISMNSWVRDEYVPWLSFFFDSNSDYRSIVMQGTSPFSAGFRSPSYHSSSYLPKLEANFMKDFFCCGAVYPSMHDLLNHFEEKHREGLPPVPATQTLPKPVSTAPATSIAQQILPPQSTANPASIQSGSASTFQHTGHERNMGTSQRREQPSRQQLQALQDMESVEDMEMDDMMANDLSMANLNSGYPLANNQNFLPMSQYAHQPSNVPALDLKNPTNPLQTFQGLRQSQPGTPVSAGGRPFHANPTVSSVNTPTMTSHPYQNSQMRTPDSSGPSSPEDADPELTGGIHDMSVDGAGFVVMPQNDIGMYGYGNDGNFGEVYIDDPAKRLFSSNASNQQNQQIVHQRLGSAQYAADSDIAKRIRERQINAGLADTVGGHEPKPFRCPVIGCEKAYKNQNGLKYHKTVSNFTHLLLDVILEGLQTSARKSLEGESC